MCALTEPSDATSECYGEILVTGPVDDAWPSTASAMLQGTRFTPRVCTLVLFIIAVVCIAVVCIAVCSSFHARSQ